MNQFQVLAVRQAQALDQVQAVRQVQAQRIIDSLTFSFRGCNMAFSLDLFAALQPIAMEFEHNRVDEARKKFQQLASSDKNEIYRIIWVNSWVKGGEPNPHPRYGELAFEGREFQISNSARAEAIGCYTNSILTGYLQKIAQEFRENCTISKDLRYSHIQQTCIKFDRLPEKIRNPIYYHLWKLKGHAHSHIKFGEIEFKKNLDGVQAEAIENYLEESHHIFKVEKEKKKFLSVVSSSDKIQYQLDLVIKDVSSLLKSPKSRQILVCKRIRRVVQELVVRTNTLLSELTKKDQQLGNELNKTISDCNRAIADLKTVQSKVYDYETELQELRREEENIDKVLHKKIVKIQSLERKINDERALRIYGLTDLLPGVGFVSAFITRRYRRMIPLYSSVKGFISLVHKTVETQNRKLNTKKCKRDELNKQIKFICEKIHEQNSRISENNRKIDKLNDKISSKETETKRLGQRLTYLRDINFSLKAILIKYKFLDMQVEVVQDLIEEFDLLEEDLVVSLINEVQTLKQSHAKALTFQEV